MRPRQPGIGAVAGPAQRPDRARGPGHDRHGPGRHDRRRAGPHAGRGRATLARRRARSRAGDRGRGRGGGCRRAAALRPGHHARLRAGAPRGGRPRHDLCRRRPRVEKRRRLQPLPPPVRLAGHAGHYHRGDAGRRPHAGDFGLGRLRPPRPGRRRAAAGRAGRARRRCRWPSSCACGRRTVPAPRRRRCPRAARSGSSSASRAVAPRSSGCWCGFATNGAAWASRR